MELALEKGRIVEGYVIRDLLADGPGATLWRVEHAQRGSLHVLKVLARADSRRQARLEQEVVLGSVLLHKNIVPCTQLVDVMGHPGLIMEYVDGPSLDQWLRSDPPDDLLTRLRIFRGIVLGCAYAHAKGIVHRGLKPSNVLLRAEVSKESDRVEFVARIVDFGMAKALAPEVGKYGGLTTVNTGLGTYGYAAPEQIRDASSVDHRADIYSLGCLLYELVCGIAPFAHLSQFDAFQAQREGRYRPVQQLVPGLLPGLYTLIDAMLSPDPAGRPDNMDPILETLDELLLEQTRMDELPPLAVAAADADGGELASLLILCSIPTAAMLLGAAVVFLTR